ncbi:MAG: cytochrome ubiquinol oxidase subunit I [Verrucomicrobia bacterium]|jgi:cytochrome d ubiquinol oxidase subunit I|nr:MAG: cytochrome ubiquinol oxidase subunit I [Verrucomicrobiota bacterium]MDH4470762.1 cytochrome ubiquinol oxidase subunit I [Verrucomicrobiae bacterium]
MEVEILARIQFAFTVAFHYIYPPLTMGLGLLLVLMEGTFIVTGDRMYHRLAHFWTRIFAVIFSIGTATGIVMEFEFGTNWATYSRFVGDIFGSALAAEGVFAFMLEAGFLSLLLFGWDKVGKKTHFFATCMVCLGSHFSAIWIVVANSWMQTPAGYHLELFQNGVHSILPADYILQTADIGHVRAVIDSFWEMVFNPSSLQRLCHVIFGTWLSGSFLVISVSAYYLIRGRHRRFAEASMTIAIFLAAATSVFQSISADATARGVVQHQPIKLAAMEGVYHTAPYTPMNLFGYVDASQQTVYSIQIPGLLSLLAFHNIKTPVIGLDQLPSDAFLAARNPGKSAQELAALRPQYWPKVQGVFQTYHIMIIFGSIVFGMAFFSLFLWWKGWLFRTDSLLVRLWLFLLIFSVLFPQICNQAGWFTAEMGRQPWVVYNILKTSQAFSKKVSSDQVLGSLLLFFAIYSLLFFAFLYLLNRKIQHGPDDPEEDPEPLEDGKRDFFYQLMVGTDSSRASS